MHDGMEGEGHAPCMMGWRGMHDGMEGHARWDGGEGHALCMMGWRGVT